MKQGSNNTLIIMMFLLVKGTFHGLSVVCKKNLVSKMCCEKNREMQGVFIFGVF